MVSRGFPPTELQSRGLLVRVEFRDTWRLGSVAGWAHIEKALGRQRSKSGGYTSRAIDIDILFYDTVVINQDNLQVPHPEISNRKFVLQPLVDLAPELLHPVFQKTLATLLLEAPDSSVIEQQ